jgi:hypothetical protein
LFSNRVTDVVVAKLATVPGLSDKGQQIATAVKSGEVRQAAAHVTQPQAQALFSVTRDAFTSGLDLIFLVGAIIAFTAGVLALGLIRSKDFVRSEPDAPAG